MIDATLVTVPGFWSSPATWERLKKEWCADPHMPGLNIHDFRYESPKEPALPLSTTRIPDFNDIAGILESEYSKVLKDVPEIAFATHSQGGLILQRFLARMTDQGRARELRRIRSIVMLACPNGGSEYLRSIRRVLERDLQQEGPELAGGEYHRGLHREYRRLSPAVRSSRSGRGIPSLRPESSQRFTDFPALAPLSLSFPAISPAFPLTFRRLLPVALPACFFVLPLIIFALALAFLPAPMPTPPAAAALSRVLPGGRSCGYQVPRRVHLKHFRISSTCLSRVSHAGQRMKTPGRPAAVFRRRSSARIARSRSGGHPGADPLAAGRRQGAELAQRGPDPHRPGPGRSRQDNNRHPVIARQPARARWLALGDPG